MYINICDSSGTLSVILMIKNVVTILKLLVPLFLIIVSGYDLFTAVVDVRNKVYNKIIKRIIALVCIFFIPTILSLFLDILGTTDLFSSSCWTNANTETIAILRHQEKKEADAAEKARKDEHERAEKERKELEKVREEIRKKKEEEAEKEKKKREQEQEGGVFLHENGVDGMVEVRDGIFYKPGNVKAGTEGTRGSAPHSYNKFFYNRLKAFTDAAQAAGHNVRMGSNESTAWRSYERQAYFYNCYITKSCNNGNLAAKPGTGNHGWGLASDLSFGNYSDILWAHDNCKRFGLRFSVCNNIRTGDCVENWHIEPTTIKTK